MPPCSVPYAEVVPSVRADSDDPAWDLSVGEVPLTALNGVDTDAWHTVVAVRWREDALYVRFWCRAPEPPWSPYGQTRDAPHAQGDAVEVFLDPVGDARQVVEIQVGAGNGVFDKLYLLTAEPVEGEDGILPDAVLKRDQWEFPDWDWPGLRSAVAPWAGPDGVVGWIVDLALPAEPLLRRAGETSLCAGVTLHAHFVRNAWPESASGDRVFVTFSWADIVPGRPHRSPLRMGTLELLARNPYH